MKKTIVLILCAIIAVSMHNPVFATENESEDMVENEARRVAEIPELREKNSDTYLLSDGSYECVVYAEDKYYHQDGKLIEFDNSIVPIDYKNEETQYHYVNASSSTKVYFPDNNPSILIESGKKQLSFSFADAAPTKAQIGEGNKGYKFPEFDLDSNSCITYSDVYKSVDVVYAVKKGGVKEYIILKDNDAPAEYLYEFDTTDCYIKENEKGSLDVYDLSDEHIYEFAPLFAVDSNGSYTEELKYEILKRSDTTTIVGISISKDFLEENERAFPVLIDPSIMVTGEWCTYDSYVSSRYPNTNYYLQDWLRTGRDSDFYTRRTYIKFDLPSGITKNGISFAYIDIRKYSGSAPNVKAYRATGNWSSSSLTWNNKPGYTTTNASGKASALSNNWYRLNVTNIVKGWYAGSYNNYGFVLKDATESGTTQWTTFYSSDAASPNKPELHINYTYYGTRPYQSTSKKNINCMGYALEYNQYITGSDLNLSPSAMTGKTTSQLQSYIATKAETWMRNNIQQANYGVISSYNSGINSSWYRIVLRVGFTDLDGDGVLDANENWDYHWWYQTKDGNWADKAGTTPSRYRNNTYNINPTSQVWSGYVNYNSAGKFYQIKDIRTVAW